MRLRFSVSTIRMASAILLLCTSATSSTIRKPAAHQRATSVQLGNAGDASVACSDAWAWLKKRWPLASLPPVIAINPTGAKDEHGNPLTFDQIYDVLQRAFHHWTEVEHAYLPVVFLADPVCASDGIDGQCVISWRPLDNLHQVAATREIAYGGWIVEVDIVFNSELAWSTCGAPGAFDLENVATHEAGHFWGLADLYADEHSALTMYGYDDVGLTNKRSLEHGDIEGAMHMNPWLVGTVHGEFKFPHEREVGLPGPEPLLERVELLPGSRLTLAQNASPVVVGRFVVQERAELVLRNCSPLFRYGAGLVVRGLLNARGICFFSDSSWSGITVIGHGADSTLLDRLCQVSGVAAEYGAAIRIIHSSPTIREARVCYNDGSAISITDRSAPVIQRCVIAHNRIHGLLFSNSGGFIHQNEISHNGEAGIICVDHGSPVLGMPGETLGRNNIIHDNGVGIDASFHSHPLLGISSDPSVQGNSVFANARSNLRTRTGSSVLAERVWWGSTDPTQFGIDAEVRSPVSSSAPLSNADEGRVNQNGSFSSDPCVVLQAARLRHSGDLQVACDLLISTMRGECSDEDIAPLLSQLVECVRSTGAPNVVEFCRDIQRGPYFLIPDVQHEIMVLLLEEEEQEDAACLICGLGEECSDMSIRRSALALAFSESVFRLHDRVRAMDALERLERIDQGDIHSILARLVFEILGEECTSSVGSSPYAAAIPDPSVPELLPNYPNPFNPATVIRYRVPATSAGEGLASSRVDLRVYDIVGREVAVLYTGESGPGLHSLTWDVRLHSPNVGGLSSGVYIVRLRAGEHWTARRVVYTK